MTDENSEPSGSEDTPAPAAPEGEPENAAAGEGAEAAPEPAHSAKHGFREGVAKAVGYGVEVASILGQQGGDAVKAERDVAEADTEELIDRIDGED